MNDLHHDPIHGYVDNVAALAADQAASRALKAALAADKAAEEAEWTAEITSARRATWNAIIKALPKNQKITGLPMTPGATLRAMRPVRAYTCAQCGAGFAATDQRARYCSNRCRQAAKYAKIKAARAARRMK